MVKVDHIGAIIKAVLENKGMSLSEFGRRIGSYRENAYSIFKRSSIDTKLLLKISKVLEHDFFQYYSTVAQESERLKKNLKCLKTTFLCCKTRPKYQRISSFY